MPLTRVNTADQAAITQLNQLIDLLTGVMSDQAVTILNDLVAKSVRASGVASLGSPRSTGRYVGQWTTAGAPTGLTSQIGDWGFDSNFALWICSVAGTPGTWIFPLTLAQSHATPANPTGVTGGTALMQGLAGSITPSRTGRVLVIISGDGYGAGGSDFSGHLRIRYGTGTAPVNGAAVAGTAIGATPFYQGSASGNRVPFSIQSIITGLTSGTAYWVDLSLFCGGGGTATIENITIDVLEF